MKKTWINPDTFNLLAEGLLKAGCIKFGKFTLKSGIVSPIYIDLRLLAGHPELLRLVGEVYLPVLKQLDFQRLAALPYAALPICTSICLAGGYPMIYPRKESKAYGTMAKIEGEYHPGEKVVIIDDLATTGGSKFEAIEILVEAGLVVEDVVVLVDRESGAVESLRQGGFQLYSILTISELLDHWERESKVENSFILATREFLKQENR